MRPAQSSRKKSCELMSVEGQAVMPTVGSPLPLKDGKWMASQKYFWCHTGKLLTSFLNSKIMRRHRK